MTTYTTPYSLPIIEPSVDLIKDGATASALADAINRLSNSASTGLDQAKTAAITAAISDATTKYGGLPARVTAAEDKNTSQDTAIGAANTRIDNLRALPMTNVAAADNFDNYRIRGTFAVVDNATAGTVANIPIAGAGILTVDATASGLVYQTYRGYGTNGGLFYRQTSALSPSPYPWRAWVRIDKPMSLGYTNLVAGGDLDTMRTPGKFRLISSTIAAGTANVPGVTKRAGVLDIDAFDSGIVFQTYKEYAGSVWFRSTSSVAAPPYPYSAWVDLGATGGGSATTPPSGLANSIRVDDFTQRRGGRKKTGGIAAVAFRFDHGLNNFKTEILPLLQTYGIVGSLALNSRRWTDAESNLVTQSEVDGWVSSGWVEIWNHSATHGDASTIAALTDTIVGGLTELRAQLPSAVIDGFAIPGVGGGTNLGGLNSGTTPENWYGTDAGRIILENHAVATGAFPDTDRRVLDGRVRQGMGHWTLDSQASATAITRLQGVQASKKGQQFMLHPSLMNTAGYITTAELGTILAWCATERDAGRIKIYSQYDLLLADAT